MSIFIFDVDGTLTKSRHKIDTHFSEFFQMFCQRHDVFLVTGSDKEKTIGQIGIDVYNKCKRVYQCSGNEVWEQDQLITKNDWTITEPALAWLMVQLQKSDFPLRTGRHIEHRSGMINFSVVGRNATLGERHLYIEWDKTTNERKIIAEEFNKAFPKLEATIGGDTGLDISERGVDKSQILKYFDSTEYHKMHFFGDAIYPGGNDYTIATKVEQLGGKSYKIEQWEQICDILKKLV